jgi:hypothetical protein
VRPGTPCESACPGDLVCIDQVCREPGYIPADAETDATPGDGGVDAPPDAPGDSDGDGHLDHVDNCPATPNGDQHDEDGDQIGDVCDPCPHLAGNAADADGDGVGDACDPEPSVARQSLVFFDPFTSDRAQWVHSGSVGRIGEQLRISGTSGFTRLNIASGETRIIAGGTIVSVGPSTPHSLSISFGINDGGNDYYYGNFYNASGNGGAVHITRADSGTYTALTTQSHAGAFPTGAWSMRIDESVSAQRISLLATLGGVNYPLMTAQNVGTPPLVSSPEITMYARNADFRFDYFVVIRTTP